MVTNSVVNDDLTSFEKCIESYSNEINDLKDGWKGDSSKALMQKFEEFISEYKGVIAGQMANFAEACRLYDDYQQCKMNLASAQSNYSTAPAEKKGSWEAKIIQYKSEKRRLTNSINERLSQIKEKLNASNRFGVINDAIEWACEIANDDDWTYRTGGIGAASGYTYDCASLVANAYNAAGVPLVDKYGFWGGVSGLRHAIDESGQFEKVYDWGGDDPEHVGLVTEEMLQPGDILYNGPNPEANWGHAAMYIGDGQCVAEHGTSYGEADQINVYDYTPVGWNCVYRYKGDN